MSRWGIFCERRGTSPTSEVDLQRLLMEYADHLEAYIQRAMPNELRRYVSVEDVLQETWVAVFSGIEGFREDGPRSLECWLTSIAQRKLVDAIRRARAVKRGGGLHLQDKVQMRTTSYMRLFERVRSAQRTPSSEDAAREAVHAVQIALSTLPEECRSAMTMRHIEGCSRAEVARVLHKTGPAISTLLNRGLRLLRKRLQPAGRFLSEKG